MQGLDRAARHDLCVTQVHIGPGGANGASGAGGAGLSLAYGYHASPFGDALAVLAPVGLVGLGFVDAGNRAATLADMQRRWPKAELHEDSLATGPVVQRAFNRDLWRADQPLQIALIGSDFDMLVWGALLDVPFGTATSYLDLAAKIAKPKAARAVGAAVGRNPIGFVVPCHRIVGRSGALTGYHWGLARKQAMLSWEASRTETNSTP